MRDEAALRRIRDLEGSLANMYASAKTMEEACLTIGRLLAEAEVHETELGGECARGILMTEALRDRLLALVEKGTGVRFGAGRNGK